MMILDPDRHQATDETSPKPASQYGWTCSDSLNRSIRKGIWKIVLPSSQTLPLGLACEPRGGCKRLC
ncbi:hypothetical protein PGT21_007773 [Puccinia graminis f. sp. tritici]|uniref:Uncharacterized protein n=1 Tax=Puccinia graminis f. sp. tritici TaxID=56615 RepID=A0A5B0LMD9_PUCGR|nr:hypothetical protein PGT21_007773 [Puccinia graminis f. sp. tritici]